ncbi:MAG: hypothetical protein ACYDGS_04040 [Thermoleophilia bacterium]
MERGLTSEEEMRFGAATGEVKRQSIAMEIKTREAAQAAKAEAKAVKSLSIAEKTAFGVATVFSTIVLVILVMLTIIGFIFSPITDTLIFGLLAAATGLSSYFIWRGGKRQSSSS